MLLPGASLGEEWEGQVGFRDVDGRNRTTNVLVERPASIQDVKGEGAKGPRVDMKGEG